MAPFSSHTLLSIPHANSCKYNLTAVNLEISSTKPKHIWCGNRTSNRFPLQVLFHNRTNSPPITTIMTHKMKYPLTFLRNPLWDNSAAMPGIDPPKAAVSIPPMLSNYKGKSRYITSLAPKTFIITPATISKTVCKGNVISYLFYNFFLFSLVSLSFSITLLTRHC